jgi:hypothetical protein
VTNSEQILRAVLRDRSIPRETRVSAFNLIVSMQPIARLLRYQERLLQFRHDSNASGSGWLPELMVE